MFQNISHSIKIALELKISKKIIEKTIPSLTFPGRFNYLKKGRIKKMLHKNETIMIDGAHAPADAKNLYDYLKKLKLPKYGVWSMTKNKEPDLFIKELKNIFRKIFTVPIDNESSSVTASELNRIAIKNKINSEEALLERNHIVGKMSCDSLKHGITARYLGSSSQAARYWFCRIWAHTRYLRKLSMPRILRLWPMQENPFGETLCNMR